MGIFVYHMVNGKNTVQEQSDRNQELNQAKEGKASAINNRQGRFMCDYY